MFPPGKAKLRIRNLSVEQGNAQIVTIPSDAVAFRISAVTIGGSAAVGTPPDAIVISRRRTPGAVIHHWLGWAGSAYLEEGLELEEPLELLVEPHDEAGDAIALVEVAIWTAALPPPPDTDADEEPVAAIVDDRRPAG